MSLLTIAAHDPVWALTELKTETRRRVEHAAGPLVIFIVAAAILLGLAITIAGAAALYCIHKGGNLEWFTKNGWKVWEFRVACRMQP